MNRVAVVIHSRLEGAGKSSVRRAMMFVDELRRGGDCGHASPPQVLLEGRQIVTF